MEYMVLFNALLMFSGWLDVRISVVVGSRSGCLMPKDNNNNNNSNVSSARLLITHICFKYVPKR